MKLQTAVILLLGASHSCFAKTTRGAEQGRRRLQITLRSDDFEIIQDERLDEDEPGILANDDPVNGLEVVDHTERSGFQGDLDVYSDGRIRYEPPDSTFIGTETFDYEACLISDPTVCSTAPVTIRVVRDPNRPDRDPIAKDDSYDVTEGNSLDVGSGSGFLSNDSSGSPSNPLFRCDYDDGGMEGDVDTDSDGSFTYDAPRCWTGQDRFTYRACYEDFDEMESNEAIVTINVKQDPNRPNRPSANSDTYTVYEAETLDVGSGSGILNNDGGGSLLYVNDYDERDGFVGDLDVDSDGSFTYEAISGELGNMVFDYEVCQDGWEECVDCVTTSVTIQVQVNPNKPTVAPESRDETFQIEAGQLLTGNIVSDNVDFDSRYTVEISDVSATAGNVELDDEDGDYQYGNGPVGTATITYTACYVEWPDLCADGSFSVETLAGSPGSGGERQGVATFYEVNWVGSPTGECAAVTPTLTLSCAGEGVIDTIVAGASDNASCNKTVTGELICGAKTSGRVFVECRDFGGRDDPFRQLVVAMTSPSVTCSGTNPPYHLSHYVSHRVWCNEAWTAGTIGNCTGGTALIDAVNGNQLCYIDENTLANSAALPALTMTASGFETCTDFGLAPSTAGEPGVLTVIGDADGDEGVAGYPLQNCQADCDDDDECAGDLICFSRSGDEPVPGCVGVPEEGRDYCIYPIQDDFVVVARSGGRQ